MRRAFSVVIRRNARERGMLSRISQLCVYVNRYMHALVATNPTVVTFIKVKLLVLKKPYRYTSACLLAMLAMLVCFLYPATLENAECCREFRNCACMSIGICTRWLRQTKQLLDCRNVGICTR